MSETPLSGWLNATVAQRQRLYRATKRLIDAGFLTWGELYRDALESPTGFGKGYDDNFRSGRISRKNATRIVRYLAERLTRPQPTIPIEFAPDVLDTDSFSDWNTFVASHALREGLIPGVVRTGRRIETSSLRVGERVSFAWQGPLGGRIFGLYGRSGGWRALPLHTYGINVEDAPVYVSLDNDFETSKAPMSLERREGFSESGQFTLVLVLVPDAAPDYTLGWQRDRLVPTSQLDRLCLHLALTQTGWRLWCINLEIIAGD